MDISYVEDRTLTLPNVEDGPGEIGDLWDCRSSQTTGFNLFGKEIQKYHLSAYPTKTLEYTLTHVKSSKDKTRSLAVSGELSVEFLAGILKVTGSAEYENKRESNSLDEELLCNYHSETFTVRALPSAKEIIDEHIKNKILKGELKATHVVNKVILGGEVTALILIKMKGSSNGRGISGGFLGKIPLGSISASAKTELSLLDSDLRGEFEKRIILQSKPPIKTPPPDSINGMFSIIESIHDIINEEKHFPHLNVDGVSVIGVPLRYILVPISQYLELKIEPLYMSIGEEILKSYLEMLQTLKDLQASQFMRKKILENDFRIQRIILDDANGLTKRIRESEEKIGKDASNFALRAVENLKIYKLGKIKLDEISEFVNEVYLKESNLEGIQQEIDDFTKEGKEILSKIRINDLDENSPIKIFTNATDLENWISNDSGIKLLLKTNGTSPPGTFILYELVEDLFGKSVKVGVALSNISDDFSLSLKIKEDLVTYKNEEIPFVVKILSVLIGKGKNIDKRFIKLCSCIKGLKSQDFQLENLPSIILLLKKFSFFETCENWFQLEQILGKEDDQYKFIVAADADYSVFDAIKKASIFKDYLPDGRWIFGDFELGKNYLDAPILFVFKNGEILFSIYDNLDYHFLINKFKINRLEDLKNAQIFKNFINLEKSAFLSEFKNTFLDRKDDKFEKQCSQQNESVTNLLKVINALISEDKFKMLEVIIEIFKKNHSKIFGEASIGINLYDSDGKLKIKSEDDVVIWRKFLNMVKSEITPFFGELNSALTDLSKCGPNSDKIGGIIKSLKKSKNCPEDLRYMLNAKSFQKEELVIQLDKKMGEILAQSSKVHRKSLIRTVENYIDHFQNAKEIRLGGIALDYLDVISDPDILKSSESIKNKLTQNNYHQAINILAPLRFSKCTWKVLQEINELTEIDNLEQMTKFIKNLGDLQLPQSLLEKLLNCDVFMNYMDQGLKNSEILKHFEILIGQIPNYSLDSRINKN